jgi:hypothetical protein
MPLQYITCDKVNLDKFTCIPYLCEDMSVKHSEKKYRKAVKDEKYKIKDNKKFGYIQLMLGRNPVVKVTTPVMKCLFGVKQSYGDNFNMSLQFKNLQQDEKMKSFFEFIQRLEYYTMNGMGLTEDDSDCFISQIKYDKQRKYDPNLSVKLPFSCNKFETELYSDHSSIVSLFNINNFTDMQCDIYLDKIWKINETFHCKWKCSCIHLV